MENGLEATGVHGGAVEGSGELLGTWDPAEEERRRECPEARPDVGTLRLGTDALGMAVKHA